MLDMNVESLFLSFLFSSIVLVGLVLIVLVGLVLIVLPKFVEL